MLRILGGRFRGRKLLSPPGTVSRPTLSRLRQALFNILRPGLPEAAFLDLYAGAGTIGLEAYSEGCRRVVLVESDRAVLRVLRENCGRLDQGGALRVLEAPALVAAERLERAGEKFDVVFLDPPYGGEALAAWDRNGRLAGLVRAGGRLILQSGARDRVPEAWSGLRRVRERTYGKTRFTFFAHPEGKESEHA